jgi:NAD(P)-dependent dehydrogenase (short-subunit alcohol dehydrogenase family)
MKIEGTTAFITGGASGLGAATAKRLHAMGANIVIADFNQANGESLCSELGERTAFALIDITNTQTVQAAIKMTMERFGAVHTLVNCAGSGWVSKVVGKEGPHDLDVFVKIINLNLVGTFDSVRLCAYEMQKNDPNEDGERGVIVNTASLAAFEGQMGQVAYAASKAGVAGMTLVIARDLARSGIRCCSIAPGTFETPLTAFMTPEIRESLAEQTPFPKRFGRPDEFASLVQQIVENSYLNGENIRLDGAIRMPPR